MLALASNSIRSIEAFVGNITSCSSSCIAVSYIVTQTVVLTVTQTVTQTVTTTILFQRLSFFQVFRDMAVTAKRMERVSLQERALEHFERAVQIRTKVYISIHIYLLFATIISQYV
jgi:hypothetical protein